MKSRSLIFFITLFFVLSVWSCIKENKQIDYDITAYKWEVVKIKDVSAALYKNTKDLYVLEFINENEYALNLDVNSCGGTYTIIENKISFDGGCTEICCDSEFAESMINIFSNAEEYYTTENELHISGEGEIIFFKYSE